MRTRRLLVLSIVVSVAPLLLAGWSVSVAQEVNQSPAVQSAADSTTTEHGDILLMADSLAARYAGREELQEARAAAARNVTGFLRYERTLVPLNHAGPNVFQSVVDDPRLLNAIRRLKGNREWEPFQPGQTRTVPYDYHYGQDGTTRLSQHMRGSFERALTPARRVGYRLDTGYREEWGPFPNQRTARLDGLLRLSARVSRTHQATVKLLGLDNGWHVKRGNTVYTDRARYMLEGLNTWRARTGGLEVLMGGQPTRSLSYQAHVRALSAQWASDPSDSSSLSSPGFPLPPLFLDGLFPITVTPVFAAHRSTRTLSFGVDLTLQPNQVHTLTAGADVTVQRLSQEQRWRPSVLPDQFDLRVQPRYYAVTVGDRFRFWALAMGLSLRYEVYDPGKAVWRDVYRTLVDERAVQDAVRQLLLAAGGDSKGTQLLSPAISVVFPYRSLTTHATFSVASHPPSFEELYAAPEQSTSPYADRSITALRPQRVTTLEGGISLSRRAYTLDVTAFYRDAERYTPVFGPEVLPQTASNYPGYWGRINAGLHQQRGMEVILIHPSLPVGKAGVRLSGRLSYLYLFNLGRVRETDYPLGPGDPLTLGDFTTFDRQVNDFWNRRHWVATVVTLRFRTGVTITTVGHLHSGTPYRAPRAADVGRVVRPDEPIQIKFGPWTRRIDARVDVPLPFRSLFPATTVFCEIRNLANDQNLDVIPDPRWFENTGQPDNPVLNQSQGVYARARAIWAGVEVRW